MAQIQSPEDHLRSLEQALSDLATYPGLGPEFADDRHFAEIAARVVNAGAIVPYVDETRLRWQKSIRAINQTIWDKMSAA